MTISLHAVSRIKLALLALLFGGISFLAPTHSKAQSSILYDFYTAPSGPYVATNVAITRVQTHLDQIKTQMEANNPQSDNYKYLSIKHDFFSIIYDQLVAGKTVKESIEAGLRIFTTDVASGLPKAKREEFKQEAINLLKP
ncbi:MAG TPA: hypothetical protein VJ508_02800 [Saprospiraceae bacterium]|nr:hypothetical protein [Saprospiraceae bacterium]